MSKEEITLKGKLVQLGIVGVDSSMWPLLHKKWMERYTI